MTHSRVHRAAWGGQSRTLQSGDTTLTLHRRTTGWGWGELHSSTGQPLAVLDHFGELALQGGPVPMRLEAQDVEEIRAGFRFRLASVDVREALRGTSFENWVGIPFVGPVLTGSLEVTTAADGGFEFEWQLESQLDVSVEYLRGPWLTVGRSSFGAERDDVILPGIEWAQEREWTSGDDWFRDPWGMRATPPVDSVSIPVMAVSRGGVAISLSWDAAREAAGWFNYRRERLQPVFASPNFVERQDSSLLGLMLPEARGAGDGWRAEQPLEMHRGQRIELHGVIHVQEGTALDAVVAHVRRTGLPEPAETDLVGAVHRIAETYATTLWRDGEGFGLGQTPGDVSGETPRFVTKYLELHPGTAQAAALRERIATLPPHSGPTPEAVHRRGEELLRAQSEDGSFRLDPEGLHRTKDDFVVARDLVAPMGLAGESALGLTAACALDLLRVHDATGDERYAAAARRALAAARAHRRPEGGDYWETPLHAPNLLAAGHGAVAHASAWRRWGDEEDRLAARHWLRSLLVFTHLWEPKGRPMLYNTKPCLCSSDWYFAHWVRDHVQWEVIDSVALSGEFGVDLTEVDPELDWDTYQRGVVTAGLRWLLDHRRDDWRPHNLPGTLDLYRAGRFDGCLPDTHNSTTGLYGGMAIPPGQLGLAALRVLRH